MDKAFPLSVSYIRLLALKLREVFGLTCFSAADMPKIYDNMSLLSPQIGSFSYEVIPNETNFLDEREEARTIVNTGKILIKEWVWNEACNKRNCRATFTLAHELGHYLFTVLLGFPLSRTKDNIKVRPFEDPEWQANTFASEFLMPYEECLKLTPEEISQRYNVSMACAVTRKDKVMRETYKKSKIKK